MSKKNKDLVPAIGDVPYRKHDIVVKFKAGEDLKFELNDQMFMIRMNSGVPATKDLILGDKIVKIGGKTPKNKQEAQTMLAAQSGDVILSLMRRQHTTPVTAERQTKAALVKMDGFSYFVVSCVKEPKDIAASFGFTVNSLKNKAHVLAVEQGSIASRYFAAGDALVDLDGTPLPFNDCEFLKGYAQKFFKQGRFSAVIERPIAPEALLLYNRLFKLMLPMESDVEMGLDAQILGKQAADMHRMVFCKLRPRSVMTKDAKDLTGNASQTVADMTVETKGVRIVNKTLVTRIGSDVEDEDDLKPVEKKSHSAESYGSDDF